VPPFERIVISRFNDVIVLTLDMDSSQRANHYRPAEMPAEKRKDAMKQAKRILRIGVARLPDDSPDTSWLGEYSNQPEGDYSIDRAHDPDCLHNDPTTDFTQTHDWDESQGMCLKCEATDCSEICPEWTCDCNNDGDVYWNRREYRYFNTSGNYKGKPLADIVTYTKQDYARMERLNAGDWYFIGIRACADITIDDTKQSIYSSGLWGIESDSEESYLKEEEANQLAELRTTLYELGFSKRAIATTIKDAV
jgi:hypothetical protein